MNLAHLASGLRIRIMFLIDRESAKYSALNYSKFIMINEASHRLGILFLGGIVMAILSTATFGLEGQVVSVIDGDTIELLDPYMKLHKIRLYCIDAPEKSMPFGQRAKQKLSELIYSKDLSINVTDTDRYGREIGDLILNGRSINLEMVRSGFAWEYPKYCRDSAYWSAQNKAAAARLGLWADRDPIPPWEYRKRK